MLSVKGEPIRVVVAQRRREGAVRRGERTGPWLGREGGASNLLLEETMDFSGQNNNPKVFDTSANRRSELSLDEEDDSVVDELDSLEVRRAPSSLGCRSYRGGVLPGAGAIISSLQGRTRTAGQRTNTVDVHAPINYPEARREAPPPHVCLNLCLDCLCRCLTSFATSWIQSIPYR